MNVGQLIAELSQIEDKERTVIVRQSFATHAVECDIDFVAESDNAVEIEIKYKDE